ncbi:tail fiber protein [Erwinia phage FBB1]|nr:tail fiber protein [Erwinia phage FBB1]
MAIKLNETQKVSIRELLKTKLSTGVTDIVFEKADGTVRVIKGTRDKDLLPARVGSEVVRKESVDMVPLFDTEINDWRAFSIDKLISVNGVKVEHIVKLAG